MNTALALDDEEAVNVLEAAARIADSADAAAPRILLRRMRDVAIVLIISLAMAVAALLALLIGLPQSESAQLVAAFVLLGSVAISLAAAFGFGLIAWGAFVNQRVNALETSMTARAAIEGNLFYATALQSDETKAFICERVVEAVQVPAERKIAELACRRTLEVTERLAVEHRTQHAASAMR